MQRPPDDDLPPDDASFRDAVGDVKPLPPRPAVPRPPPPRPRAAFRRADERAVLEESLALAPGEWLVETGDELLFRRARLPGKLLERLRRGEFAVEDELDLHGLTAVEARAALRQFLTEALARRRACVRIVHGKGLRSRNREPVLKGKLRKWLPMRQEVLAFCQAPAAEGGAGALLVLLKARS